MQIRIGTNFNTLSINNYKKDLNFGSYRFNEEAGRYISARFGGITIADSLQFVIKGQDIVKEIRNPKNRNLFKFLLSKDPHLHLSEGEIYRITSDEATTQDISDVMNNVTPVTAMDVYRAFSFLPVKDIERKEAAFKDETFLMNSPELQAELELSAEYLKDCWRMALQLFLGAN